MQERIEQWIESQDINTNCELIEQAIKAVESNNNFQMQIILSKINELEIIN